MYCVEVIVPRKITANEVAEVIRDFAPLEEESSDGYESLQRWTSGNEYGFSIGLYDEKRAGRSLWELNAIGNAAPPFACYALVRPHPWLVAPFFVTESGR